MMTREMVLEMLYEVADRYAYLSVCDVDDEPDIYVTVIEMCDPDYDRIGTLLRRLAETAHEIIEDYCDTTYDFGDFYIVWSTERIGE